MTQLRALAAGHETLGPRHATLSPVADDTDGDCGGVAELWLDDKAAGVGLF